MGMMQACRVLLALGLLTGAAGCDGRGAGGAQGGEGAAPTATPSPVHAPQPGDAAVPDSADLLRAAGEVLAFLRGQLPFERLRLADTVALYLAPEGGGDSVRVARQRLRDAGEWRVRTSRGGYPYRFAPPARATRLTARVGSHLNCQAYPLAAIYPDLARLPHVGTSVAPPDADSCLQSHNLTFVFAAGERPPRLVAVVYDQWEW